MAIRATPNSYRPPRSLLGSASEADDAVQEAWLRLDRADTSGVGIVR